MRAPRDFLVPKLALGIVAVHGVARQAGQMFVRRPAVKQDHGVAGREAAVFTHLGHVERAAVAAYRESAGHRMEIGLCRRLERQAGILEPCQVLPYALHEQVVVERTRRFGLRERGQPRLRVTARGALGLPRVVRIHDAGNRARYRAVHFRHAVTFPRRVRALFAGHLPFARRLRPAFRALAFRRPSFSLV